MLENLVCGSLIYAGSCDFTRRRQPTVVYRTGSMSNPFIAYDDGYVWPDLYSECDEMLESCVLVYLLAELRSLVRKGEATSKTMRVMRMPITAKDLMRVVVSSRLLLSLNDTGCSSMELAANGKKFCHDLLRTTDERCMRIKKKRKSRKQSQLQNLSSTSTPSPPSSQSLLYAVTSDEDDDYGIEETEEELGAPDKPVISTTTFVAFADHFEEEELTYATTINHERRRITISFRGSVVSNIDWATDFDTYMKEVKNPMKMHSTQQPTMRIHSKLYDLLYAKLPQNPQGVDASINTSEGGGEEVYTMAMDILQNHIRPVADTYPGYKLYFTGHSYGAAIATLFAFLAAAEPDAIIPKPVTCVSVASPYVGDESFRLAHQMLEGLGKLRHIRVSNHKDVVTASPKMSFRWSFYKSKKEDGGSHVGSLFKHVGMNLRLYQHEQANDKANPALPVSYEISYPKVTYGFFMASYFDEMVRGWDQSPFTNLSCNPVDYWTWPWHNIREYNNRLARNKAALQKMSLNELYSRKDIVGNLGSQF